MELFLQKIDSGEIQDVVQLKLFYKKALKDLHPDLKKHAHDPVDFDQLKQAYRAAIAYLETKNRPEIRMEPPDLPKTELHTREAFVEEFLELFARGFPVNPRILGKNKPYVESIRKVEAYLAVHFQQHNFFLLANSEMIILKKEFPKTYWYMQQIIWNIGDFRHTGFDYYRRISVRHLAFNRSILIEHKLSRVLKLIQFIVGDIS